MGLFCFLNIRDTEEKVCRTSNLKKRLFLCFYSLWGAVCFPCASPPFPIDKHGVTELLTLPYLAFIFCILYIFGDDVKDLFLQ